MQREFSKELVQDRDFEFGGEVFTYRLVPWKVATASVQNARDVLAQTNGQTDDATTTVQKNTVDKIPTYLEADSAEKMTVLLNSDEAPPIGQVNALYEWLLEVSAGRPTEQPSPSSGGRQRTPSTSRAG